MMKLMKLRILLLTTLGATCILAGSSALAQSKKSRLTPAKIKQIKKDRKSFETCRKEVLQALKQGEITKAKFDLQLAGCQEKFPGASLYITCKKQAIRAASAKNLAPDKAVEQCKRYLVATTFDPKTPLPYFAEAGQVFFAGIGLNRSLPVSALSPPNFDCERLKSVARNPANAQYLLFGNHPRVFAGLADRKGAELAKTLKFTKPSQNGVDVAGFGRLFGDPKTSSGVVFFPSASCDFDAETGDIFAGLSAYYILDPASSMATPYFGIAYYKQDSGISTKKLVTGLVRALGGSFKTFSKGSSVTFVAADSVSETDEEQDPKNLCLQPRIHKFVGVVQGRKDNPAQPEYVILANVKNLCDFGDRMASRLVR